MFRAHAPSNVAVITGGDFLAVEADSLAGEQEVLGVLKGLRTPTRERREGRGRGWVFWRPPHIDARNKSHRGESRAIDVRGRGGIFILPNSLHHTGALVTWVAGLEPWCVKPTLPPDALLKLLGVIP